MRLLLLRHGETTVGAGRYLGSREDPGLSAAGRAQAVAAGRRLGGHPLVAVAVSPQRRARETAALAAPGLEPVVEPRLREMDFGVLSGLTWEEVERRHPEVACRWRRDLWPDPPGGETPGALFARVLAAGLELAARHPGGDVLAVCHGGPIRALRGTASGRAPQDCWRVRTPWGGLRAVRVTPAVTARWRGVLDGLSR